MDFNTLKFNQPGDVVDAQSGNIVYDADGVHVYDGQNWNLLPFAVGYNYRN